ncbi:cadherin repeat domain-containing protein, partial [Lutimaribacter sp. EGI FJ00014]|nr:cadherin repeat domain-containing protein [Lutimaribacter sp. EGI FJ00014]
MTIFGKNCFSKLQRKVSWTAPVGTRVLRLKDFIHEEDPASLRLRGTPWRKYFRFDAKSDYLVLRKSLLGLQENTLVVELAFPVGSENASGNKQVLVARLELFIDKNEDNYAKKVRRFRRRPQKTAPRFSSSQLIAKVRSLFFGIDPNTRLIKTSASLDREKMPTHYFRIKAEYEQERSLYAEADLTIYVD